MFDRYFAVRGFEPADDLAVCVSHYWVMRWQLPYNVTYRPTEVLPAPVVHAFFTAQGAFVHGISDGVLNYDTAGAGTMAGIAFKPGGFAPYWGGRINQLRGDGRIDLATVFPNADPCFCSELLQLPEGPVGACTGRSAALEADRASGAAPAAHRGRRRIHDATGRPHHGQRPRGRALPQRAEPAGCLRRVCRRRLQMALEAATSAEGDRKDRRQTHPDWAGVAADMGYSSQTHLLNDFKRVVGVTPTVYLRQLRRQQ